MARMKRGVGYCTNPACEDRSKGVFLLNFEGIFECPRCKISGKVEKETGESRGDHDLFREVRVEYNYDPVTSVYHEIGIVIDESLPPICNSYTLKSPLIKTQNRALKVAEAILAGLNHRYASVDDGVIPRMNEHILSFNDDLVELKRKLRLLVEGWEKSNLTRKVY